MNVDGEWRVAVESWEPSILLGLCCGGEEKEGYLRRRRREPREKAGSAIDLHFLCRSQGLIRETC